MVRAASLFLLLLAGAAAAEYHPGFSLYRHTAEADRVLEVEVQADGRVRLLSTIVGRWQDAGAVPALDPEVLRHRPEGATRAIVFLKEGQPVLGVTGIAWHTKEGVDLLPDNWGWGICYPLDYRAPTLEEFRRAVKIAAADRDAVAEIARMRLGAERALAASRLLEKERPDVSWYVFWGHALWAHFDLDDKEPLPGRATYVSELRMAVAAALNDLTAEEAKALVARVAALPPGAPRRELVELVSGTEAAALAFDLLRSCHETAKEIEEWDTTARAMRRADAKRADPILVAEAPLAGPERCCRLLDLLGPRDPLALDLAAEILRGLLATEPASLEASNLAERACRFLREGRRAADRPILLAVARSRLSCRAQALAHLKEWTGKGWEAGDTRWDELLGAR